MKLIFGMELYQDFRFVNQRKPVMHNVKCLLVCQPVNRNELIDNQNKFVWNYEFYLHKTGYCIVTRYLLKKFRIIAEKSIQ